MSDQANVEAIKAHIAAFTKQDIEAVRKQCTEDVVWTPPSSKGVLPSKTFRGRDGVAEYCKLLIDALDWEAFEVPLILAADDDHVVVKGREIFTVRATSTRLDNTIIMLFKMRDGLIAEVVMCDRTDHEAQAAAVA